MRADKRMKRNYYIQNITKMAIILKYLKTLAVNALQYIQNAQEKSIIQTGKNVQYRVYTVQLY